MAARQYAPVPDIVLTQLEVVNTLTQNTMCRGNVAYPAQLTTTRIIGAPLSVSFLSSLFADLYATVDDSVVWQVQTNTDQLILQQVANAEVDIGFVNPNNVSDPTSLLPLHPLSPPQTSPLTPLPLASPRVV